MIAAYSARTVRRAARPVSSITCGNAVRLAALPNKRLKLPGGDRSKGSGVLCAGARELSFNYTALGGRVARSLGAIRASHMIYAVADRLLDKLLPTLVPAAG